LGRPAFSLQVVDTIDVRVRPTTRLDEWPATFDMLVALIDDDERTGEVQVGSDFYNAGADRHGRSTKLFLTHPLAVDEVIAPARPRLPLLSASGRDRLTRRSRPRE
jgi:hypothetical protein